MTEQQVARNPAPATVAIGDRLRVMFEHVDRGLARLGDIACCVPADRSADRNRECRHGDLLAADPELKRSPNARRYEWLVRETSEPWFLALAEQLQGATVGIDELTDEALAAFGLVGYRFDAGKRTLPSAAHAARDLVRTTRESIAAAESLAARPPAFSPNTYSRDEYEKEQDEALDRSEATAKTDEHRAALKMARERVRADRFETDWDEAIQTERRCVVERARYGRVLTDDEHQREAEQIAAAERKGRRRDCLLYALAAICRDAPTDVRRRVSAELAVEVAAMRARTSENEARGIEGPHATAAPSVLAPAPRVSRPSDADLFTTLVAMRELPPDELRRLPLAEAVASRFGGPHPRSVERWISEIRARAGGGDDFARELVGHWDALKRAAPSSTVPFDDERDGATTDDEPD